MQAQRFLLVLTVALSLTACNKKLEEFQESQLSTGKQQTLYGIKYGSKMRNVMDISLPANRNPNTPVVVLIHGGAWVMGDKGYFMKEIEQFAKAGIACATINYRYASDITNVHHPDLPNDVLAAVNYIASKSDKWQIAPDRFGLCGHSAGGHLALITAYTLNDGRIKACGSWGGPMDLTDAEQLRVVGCPAIAKVYMGMGKETGYEADKYKEASPYWTVNGNSVPSILLHATNDEAVPYSNAVKMKAKLDALGVINELHTFDGSGHIWTGNDLARARSITLNWFKEKL